MLAAVLFACTAVGVDTSQSDDLVAPLSSSGTCNDANDWDPQKKGCNHEHLIYMGDELKVSPGTILHEHCNNIKTVYAPYAKSMGANLFSQCTYIEEIILPNLTTVAATTFKSFGHLHTLYIPMASEVGESACEGCSSLVNLTVSNTKIIGKHAFKDSGLKTVSFPAATEIGEEAFFGCNELETASFTGFVENVYEYAFTGCEKLTSVDLGPIVYNSSHKVHIHDFVFLYCLELTTLNAPCMATVTWKFLATTKVETICFPHLATIGGDSQGSREHDPFYLSNVKTLYIPTALPNYDMHLSKICPDATLDVTKHVKNCESTDEHLFQCPGLIWSTTSHQSSTGGGTTTVSSSTAGTAAVETDDDDTGLIVGLSVGGAAIVVAGLIIWRVSGKPA